MFMIYLWVAFYIFAPTATARKHKANFVGYFFDRRNPFNYQRIRKEIIALQRDLKSIAKKYGYRLNGNVCRGASGTLKHLLSTHLSIEATVIQNSYHTFLVVPDFFSKGRHLYIDPTYKQFVTPSPTLSKEPNILVGSYGEVTETLERLGAEAYAKTYLRNLTQDTSAPNWLDPSYEKLKTSIIELDKSMA